MTTKFKKDIENVENYKGLKLDDNTDYTDSVNERERIWINTYFIQQQLKAIKWTLFIIAMLLFITLIK